MRLIKAFLAILLFLGIVTLTTVGYNRCTDGFSVQQLISDLPFNLLFETSPLSIDTKQNLARAVDQPFKYIGKGCQFYAFESADGQYVLKFLKQKHLRLWTELNQIPLPASLREKANQRMASRRTKVAHLFTSCKLAYEELAEESGLLLVHLNRTPLLHKKVCIIDKMGLKHQLNLDDYEFILQKKAIPLTHFVASIAQSSQFDQQMSACLDQLIDLVHKRCEKGIRDRDRSFVKNVALEKDRAIFIDVGQFCKDPTILCQKQQKLDIQKRMGDLQAWVDQKYPARSEQLKQLIQKKMEALEI
jgi:hypothetical protein